MSIEIKKTKIDIGNNMNIKNDGNSIDFHQPFNNDSNKKPVYIKCGNEEIKIIDGEGKTDFKNLFIDGENVAEKFKYLENFNKLMRSLKFTEVFKVDETSKVDGIIHARYRAYDRNRNGHYVPYWVDEDENSGTHSTDNADPTGNRTKTGWVHNATIHETSYYGSEYVYFNGGYGEVIDRYYTQNLVGDKLRPATIAGSNKIIMEPPFPGYKYKIIFSNFINVAAYRFEIDNGVYNSTRNTPGSIEMEINTGLKIWINSLTVTRPGNLGSVNESQAQMNVSILLSL